MKKAQMLDIDDFTSYSRDELLNVIKELQQENTRLLNSFQNKQSTLTSEKPMSFRQQYAEKILDALPDMLSVVTDDGLMIAIVSSEDTNHSGFSRDKIKGVPVTAFLPPHVCDHVMESIDQAIEYGISENLNHLMLVDGQTHYFENRTVRIEENCNLCLCRDITKETVAKMQSESLSYAVNLVNENIFSLNVAGDFLFANKQFLEDHQLKKDIVGQSAIGVMYSCRDLQVWELLKEKVADNNGVLSYILEHVDLDGEKICYEVVLHSVQNINNEEEFWFFAQNITQRLQQEQEFNNLNELMKSILSNIPIYLFVKDMEDFRYQYWNNALEELTGIPSEKAVGRTDFELFADLKERETFMLYDSEIIQQNRRIEYIEHTANTNGEVRTLRAIKLPVQRDDKKPFILGVALDITDAKIVEQELITAKLEAEKSNQIKSAFLANMSHEIRTPLNAIVGFAKLILEDDDDESRREYSDIIDNNADLLLQLINDILDLSKIEAGMLDFVMQKVNMDELCRNMYEIHRMRVSKDVSIIYEGNNDDLVFETDPNRLAQVFTNLISNAIKFTSSGEIRFGYQVKGNQIEAFVRDTGLGISAEKLPTIFDRFVKLNTFVQGTGLGLSITRTIIDRLGGTISVSSEEGKWTEFRFSIPYQKTTEEQDVQVVEPECPDTEVEIDERSRKNVLIVEDNDSNYLLLSRLLKDKSPHFRARNGEEAISMFLEHDPSLIFMDIKMPVMDGLEATRIIRTHSADVPIVALTAFAYESDKESAFAAGCTHFLTKPVAFDQIQLVMERYLKDM